MGPSGAGKTSLLNVISGKATAYGIVSGSMMINGKREAHGIAAFKRAVGFVPQEDTMMRTMSPKEILTFSAQMRLPPSTPAAEVKSLVIETLDRMNLWKIRQSPVGDEENRGISGGQRKRVNIGMELVIDPSVVFLDEPTSGEGTLILWSSVDPALPSPLPCYGPLTADIDGSMGLQLQPSFATSTESFGVDPLLIPHSRAGAMSPTHSSITKVRISALLLSNVTAVVLLLLVASSQRAASNLARAFAGAALAQRSAWRGPLLVRLRPTATCHSPQHRLTRVTFDLPRCAPRRRGATCGSSCR